jgi:anti-sigma regulatory factor (Ser/Thr protein kinase)
MAGVRARGEDIRRFILQNIEAHPDDISRVAAEHFRITRQAVNKHLQKLGEEGALEESGNTRARTYKLARHEPWTARYKIEPGLDEQNVWQDAVKPCLGKLPDNVMNIWHTGFTEMFNNAIEHSEGGNVTVVLAKTAADCQMMIYDDGIGIFRKIQQKFSLEDPRHAILELAKGKLTTDEKHHSGEGIFFTSRMFDSFDIVSQETYWSHEFGRKEEFILERPKLREGTLVALRLDNHTSRTALRVYNDYASADSPGFQRTVVPVRLAQYGNDQLVSRSQAKRLLARIDKFKVVLLDFAEVLEIGQAFADEIFRVFRNQHPEIQLQAYNFNPEVAQMIQRASAASPNSLELLGQGELPL